MIHVDSDQYKIRRKIMPTELQKSDIIRTKLHVIKPSGNWSDHNKKDALNLLASQAQSILQLLHTIIKDHTVSHELSRPISTLLDLFENKLSQANALEGSPTASDAKAFYVCCDLFHQVYTTYLNILPLSCAVVDQARAYKDREEWKSLIEKKYLSTTCHALLNAINYHEDKPDYTSRHDAYLKILLAGLVSEHQLPTPLPPAVIEQEAATPPQLPRGKFGARCSFKSVLNTHRFFSFGKETSTYANFNKDIACEDEKIAELNKVPDVNKPFG